MTHGTDEDDPHDESAHWIGKILEENTNSTERSDKRTARRQQQPDIQRKKPPVAKRE